MKEITKTAKTGQIVRIKIWLGACGIEVAATCGDLRQSGLRTNGLPAGVAGLIGNKIGLTADDMILVNAAMDEIKDSAEYKTMVADAAAKRDRIEAKNGEMEAYYKSNSAIKNAIAI